MGQAWSPPSVLSAFPFWEAGLESVEEERWLLRSPSFLLRGSWIPGFEKGRGKQHQKCSCHYPTIHLHTVSSVPLPTFHFKLKKQNGERRETGERQGSPFNLSPEASASNSLKGGPALLVWKLEWSRAYFSVDVLGAILGRMWFRERVMPSPHKEEPS